MIPNTTPALILTFPYWELILSWVLTFELSSTLAYLSLLGIDTFFPQLQSIVLNPYLSLLGIDTFGKNTILMIIKIAYLSLLGIDTMLMLAKIAAFSVAYLSLLGTMKKIPLSL